MKLFFCLALSRRRMETPQREWCEAKNELAIMFDGKLVVA